LAIPPISLFDLEKIEKYEIPRIHTRSQKKIGQFTQRCAEKIFDEFAGALTVKKEVKWKLN